MKFKMKNLFAIATFALLAIALPVKAQFDYWAQPRAIQIIGSANQNFTNSGPTTASIITTNIIDIHGFDGIAKIDLFVVSNTAFGGNGMNQQGFCTNVFFTGSDRTNWTLITTIGTNTPATIVYTNQMFGSTNLLATNVFLLPGLLTTVTPGSAGFASPFGSGQILLQNPFTNTASFNTSISGVYEFGFNIQDTARYLQMVTTVAGTNAEYSVQAVLTGRRTQ